MASMDTWLEDLYVFISASCKRHKVFGNATKEVENSLKLRILSKPDGSIVHNQLTQSGEVGN